MVSHPTGGYNEPGEFATEKLTDLKDGTVTAVDGPTVVNLGSAPENAQQDWACLVRKRDR